MNGEISDYYMNLPYKVELIPDEEGTTFTAVIPDLKGCASFGETVQEAYEKLTEAKRLWIETALDKEWPIPEPKAEEIKIYSGRFTVRLARYLHRELVELAEAEGTSLNQLVVALLSEGAERRRKPRRASAHDPMDGALADVTAACASSTP